MKTKVKRVVSFLAVLVITLSVIAPTCFATMNGCNFVIPTGEDSWDGSRRTDLWYPDARQHRFTATLLSGTSVQIEAKCYKKSWALDPDVGTCIISNQKTYNSFLVITDGTKAYYGKLKANNKAGATVTLTLYDA